MTVLCLTRGRYALIDDEDWERVNQWKWHANKHPHGFYAIRSVRLKHRRGTRTISLHRFIMGASRGKLVDHEDRDTLNNQKSNLRFCTGSQSLSNRGKMANNTSGFKGVSWSKQCQNWQAAAKAPHLRRKHLGRFTSKEEAAKVYDEYITAHHGEFAVTNKSLGLL